MKIRISAFLLIFAFAISFSSCKKDDPVIPDVTGSTYETYKMSFSLLGQTSVTEIASTDSEYYQWKFVEGGTLEDGSGNEIGTWTQDGANLSVVYIGSSIDCTVSGNDIVYTTDFLGIAYDLYMRKI